MSKGEDICVNILTHQKMLHTDPTLSHYYIPPIVIFSYYHCLPDHNHKHCNYEMVIIKVSLKTETSSISNHLNTSIRNIYIFGFEHIIFCIQLPHVFSIICLPFLLFLGKDSQLYM